MKTAIKIVLIIVCVTAPIILGLMVLLQDDNKCTINGVTYGEETCKRYNIVGLEHDTAPYKGYRYELGIGDVVVYDDKEKYYVIYGDGIRIPVNGYAEYYKVRVHRIGDVSVSHDVVAIDEKEYGRYAEKPSMIGKEWE